MFLWSCEKLNTHHPSPLDRWIGRTLAEQLAIPLMLMAYRSTVQDSTSISPGPEYARKLKDRLDMAHELARG